MKKIRIRHCDDKSMFFGESGWSLNPRRARIFAAPLEAIAFAAQRKISNAELVVEGDREEQFAVPLYDEPD